MGLSMKQSLILLAGVGTLAGCVSFGASEPPPFLMSLTSDIKVDGGAERSGQQTDALVVRLPTSPQKLNTLRVPVQTRATGIAYLKDAIWVDKPVRLFHGMLTETIAAKNDRLVLTSTQAGGKAEHYLSGELVNFGLDGPRLEVVVTYDAVKMKVGQPIEKRRFEARESVYAAEPGPVGESLNKAANKVVNEVADWIG
jgi:cholesterol transport system auxiliary component